MGRTSFCLLLATLSVLILCVTTLQSKSIYYLTPYEALEEKKSLKHQQVRIGGMVLTNSLKWDPHKLKADFTIGDMEDHKIKVSYKGALPDMFKENSGVVVQGSFSKDQSVFMARTLMVKHSEEYKVPGSSTMAKKLVADSLLKDM